MLPQRIVDVSRTSGRLSHRRLSNGPSRQTGPSSSGSAQTVGPEPTNEKNDDLKTRARTIFGDRLEESERPRIVPVGSAFEVHPYMRSRKLSTIIGALLRHLYPDTVGRVNERRAALCWDDFKWSPNPGRILSQADRIRREFWFRFKCDPNDKDNIDIFLEDAFKKKVPQMLSKEKKRGVTFLYANDTAPQEDIDEEGNHWPTVDALMSAKPGDFANENTWRLLCEHWSTPEFRKKSINGKRNRLSGGDTIYHCGGSRGLVATRQFLKIKTGEDLGLAGSWQHTHRMEQGTNRELCSQKAKNNWFVCKGTFLKCHGESVWRKLAS